MTTVLMSSLVGKLSKTNIPAQRSQTKVASFPLKSFSPARSHDFLSTNTRCIFSVRPRSKFQHSIRASSTDSGIESDEPIKIIREDDVLPDNLLDAVRQAAEATSAAIAAGRGRCTAELLIPELWDVISGAVMAEEGDQMRWWELSREFVLRLGDGAPAGGSVRAVFPDAGGAAMLTNRWGKDCGFMIASLDDSRPLGEDDSLVVIACPDPPSLASTIKLAEQASAKGIPVVMFNPRLASGDVGIGTNVRNMRQNFSSTFLVTYSLCPISYPTGSVFRKYPGQWQVFLEDPDSPGRFLLKAETASRPAGEALDEIIDGPSLGEGDEDTGEKSLLDQVGGALVGMQRFMKQLSQ